MGVACAGLGVWLVVVGASASTDLAQVVGVLIGSWWACAGVGLLLSPLSQRRVGPDGSGPPRRQARPGHLVLVGPAQERSIAEAEAAAQDAVLELGATG